MSPEMTALLAVAADPTGQTFPTVSGTVHTAPETTAALTAYDAAIADGATRYEAREAAARAAAETNGVTWDQALEDVRTAYRARYSTRPSYAAYGPAPLLGGRVYVEHGATH